MTGKRDKDSTPTIQNVGRRKAVKTIVGSVTAIAAYNMLPAKWDKPIIESVFLPAHAATSGVIITALCIVEITDIGDAIEITVSGSVSPAVAGLPVDFIITITGGASDGLVDPYPSTLTNLLTDANGEFSYTLGGWPTDTTRFDVTLTVQGASGSATCGADVPLG